MKYLLVLVVLLVGCHAEPQRTKLQLADMVCYLRDTEVYRGTVYTNNSGYISTYDTIEVLSYPDKNEIKLTKAVECVIEYRPLSDTDRRRLERERTQS